MGCIAPSVQTQPEFPLAEVQITSCGVATRSLTPRTAPSPLGSAIKCPVRRETATRWSLARAPTGIGRPHPQATRGGGAAEKEPIGVSIQVGKMDDPSQVHGLLPAEHSILDATAACSPSAGVDVVDAELTGGAEKRVVTCWECLFHASSAVATGS